MKSQIRKVTPEFVRDSICAAADFREQFSAISSAVPLLAEPDCKALSAGEARDSNASGTRGGARNSFPSILESAEQARRQERKGI